MGHSVVEHAAGTDERKKKEKEEKKGTIFPGTKNKKIHRPKINVDSFVSTTSKIIASAVHAFKF